MNNLNSHIYLFFFPLIIGNVLHMVIVKQNWFQELAFPISKNLFGHNKTYRGAIVLPIITGLMAIGFMSFGGMLTGGDEESTTEKETVLFQEVKSNPVSDKSIETVIEEDKELANNTKVVE